MAEYKHLFPKPISPGGATPPTPPGEIPSTDLLPLIKSESEVHGSTAIDKALAEKLGRDALLKLKAMEFVMQFLGGRTISDPKRVGEIYDVFYNKIKNGATRSQIR